MTSEPQIILTPERQRILESRENILILGGPGSGKTTIALLKAAKEIQESRLLAGQKILFLSFARATVSRIANHAQTLIGTINRKKLEVNTYHGFCWVILQSHGYLINKNKPIRLLPPSEAAALLAEVDRLDRYSEICRLFENEGLLGFDLFASVARDLLHRSKRLGNIISRSYPIIIVDEFQDTNEDEWSLIKSLSGQSQIIALADANQRIYEFRGADPARIGEFISFYNPTSFDFGLENNRSNGTDIAKFGNDLLTSINKTSTYLNVEVHKYGFYNGKNLLFPLKTKVLAGINRLKILGPSWSIAILVPTKRLMLSVSDYLSGNSDNLPSVSHDVAIDHEAPALAAGAIAGLLNGGKDKEEISCRLFKDLISHIRGRKGGDSPPAADLQLASALQNYLQTGVIRGAKRQQLVKLILVVSEQRINFRLSGDPGKDWLAMIQLIDQDSAPSPLKLLADDARYVRLLTRGTLLRESLNELWRQSGTYIGAIAAVKDALQQEHFSLSTRDWKGIHVMTIHKSKGKEFDEVFIFDGYKQGKICRSGMSPKEADQAKLALRVAVTRAIKRTTILTPMREPCELL